MSRQQYLKTLHTELCKLNEKIDRKIMLGRKYKTEARLHKLILIKMRQHVQPPSIANRLSSSLASLFYRYA